MILDDILNRNISTLNPTSYPCISAIKKSHSQFGLANNNSIRSLSTQASFPNADAQTPLLSPNESSAYALVPQLPHGTKLKPSVVNKRISRLKTYVGSEKDIRHSPWRLNLVCQFAAGLSVEDALMQLQFCHKMKAPLVAYVIQRTANLADLKDGLKPSQLEVAECFANHGTHLKRIKFMGRGRAGMKRRRHSNMRVVLREIDFDLKILQASSTTKKRKWLMRKKIAEEDAKKSLLEKEEIAKLQEATKKRNSDQ